MTMNSSRFQALTAMILLAALSRFLPHPPNATAVAAMALFAGAQFSRRRDAFLVPLLAMGLSDLILGAHTVLPLVYACFLMTVLLGGWIRASRSVGRIAAASLSASVLFFIVTNFGVWAFRSIYPKTLAGLVSCYAMALPFFRNTLAGDLAYTAVLFGAWHLLERGFPRLREANASSEAGRAAV